MLTALLLLGQTLFPQWLNEIKNITVCHIISEGAFTFIKYQHNLQTEAVDDGGRAFLIIEAYVGDAVFSSSCLIINDNDIQPK